ncbi:MAG: alpha/beta hydrolase [Opitutus sp.]|nr:alpha/beta hydrolase [Opitutus sp.]
MNRWKKNLLVVALLVTVATCAAQTSPRVPAGTVVERDLVFARAGEQNLVLDLYLPEKRPASLPVVLWIYGGAWRSRNRAQQAPKASWLAGHGYAVAVIDYRLSSEARFPAQINDCKAAVRWLRAHATKFGLDGNRIGAWGESSGGHLATLLGVTGGVADLEGELGHAEQSSRVQAVVDFFGPTDFLQMAAHALPGATLQHDSPDSPESRLVGGAIQENAAKVARANPIVYVTREVPPFFIVHGEQDLSVPLHQSELLFAALQAARRDVTFYKIAGAGHSGPLFTTEPLRAAVLAFFDQQLKSSSPPAVIQPER